MGIIEYLRRKNEEAGRMSREYSELYSRCFEGSNEGLLLNLEAWDWVHRTTRYRR